MKKSKAWEFFEQPTNPETDKMVDSHIKDMLDDPQHPAIYWAENLDTPQTLTDDLKDSIVEIIEDLVENTYTYVEWPESQEYMKEEWFEKEAVLNMNTHANYFIPTKYLN